MPHKTDCTQNTRLKELSASHKNPAAILAVQAINSVTITQPTPGKLIFKLLGNTAAILNMVTVAHHYFTARGMLNQAVHAIRVATPAQPQGDAKVYLRGHQGLSGCNIKEYYDLKQVT